MGDLYVKNIFVCELSDDSALWPCL